MEIAGLFPGARVGPVAVVTAGRLPCSGYGRLVSIFIDVLLSCKVHHAKKYDLNHDHRLVPAWQVVIP